jgi:hypothetical protein
MAFDTAGQIISDAMVELGLTAVSDPFASDDSNATQMCTLLKAVGREVLHQHQWTILRKEYAFTTVQGTATYPLPSDFHEMLDQSGWNRTNRLPLGGPLSAQEWQYLKARLVNVVFTVLFRPMAGAIYLYPDTNTPGGYSIAFEYQSSGWVRVPSLPSDIYQDYPIASDNIIQFDSLVISRGLKLAWLKAHGFDTVSAQQDYTSALDFARGHDSFVPILSLTRPGALRGVDQMIGQQSVPITGFGT